VTKKEIVKTISEEIGMTQLKTKEIVQKTFNAIVETLVEEQRIELRNFGVFEVKKRAARKARNPRTGQRVDVPQKPLSLARRWKKRSESWNAGCLGTGAMETRQPRDPNHPRPPSPQPPDGLPPHRFRIIDP
jgi:integration host factor subunit beta